MINFKKIPLIILATLLFAQISADTFLGKIINDHPYLTAFGCAVMGSASLLLGLEAKHAQNLQDECLDEGKLRIKTVLESKNFAQLSKIIEHHKLFPATITTENFDQTESERAYIAAIRYGINLTRKDYYIQKSRTYPYSFPELFVKYIIHEHDVRYWELPPVWKKKVENDKEILILKPIKRYELEVKKENRWIPGFCFGVSALNFATAVGLAAYGYTKKA
jgi:hypothetical protein